MRIRVYEDELTTVWEFLIFWIPTIPFAFRLPETGIGCLAILQRDTATWWDLDLDPMLWGEMENGLDGTRSDNVLVFSGTLNGSWRFFARTFYAHRNQMKRAGKPHLIEWT